MTASCDESFIAATYYESMRDNFEGYAWELDPRVANSKQINDEKSQLLAALKAQFEKLDPEKGQRPKLGQLFQIELALVWLIPEVALRARFWTIEDRFQRVVPKSVVQSYKSTLVNQPPGPVADAILRQRARNLLDTIHANYLINLAREQLIRRLMSILTLVAVFVMVLGGTIIGTQAEAVQAIVTIMLIGMAGAMISIIQRLQKATSRDAMVDDGIFELIGLRIGWVSVLLSVAIGGVFALFIYVLIAADILDKVLPEMKEGASTGNGGFPGGDKSPPGKLDSFWADNMYQALGLRAQADLFKLFVFAFASGFAERFVPDIITKLTKDVLPGTPPVTPPPGSANTVNGGMMASDLGSISELSQQDIEAALAQGAAESDGMADKGEQAPPDTLPPAQTGPDNSTV